MLIITGSTICWRNFPKKALIINIRLHLRMLTYAYAGASPGLCLCYALHMDVARIFQRGGGHTVYSPDCHVVSPPVAEAYKRENTSTPRPPPAPPPPPNQATPSEPIYVSYI